MILNEFLRYFQPNPIIILRKCRFFFQRKKFTLILLFFLATPPNSFYIHVILPITHILKT